MTSPYHNQHEKINYFVAYSKYVNSLLGLVSQFPFDNYVTIVDKMDYEIKNNSQNSGRRKNLGRYCKALANDELIYIDSENKLLLELESISENWKNKEACEIKLKDFLDKNKDYKENYITDSLKRLYSYLQCEHSLSDEEHKLYIQYFSLAIVVHLRSHGFSKKAVVKVFNELFSSKKKQKIESNSNREVRTDTFQERYKNFKEIIEGNKSIKRNYYFDVVGEFCHFSDNSTENIVLNKVTLHSQEKFDFEFENNFEGSIIAEVEVIAHCQRDGAKQAVLILEKELLLLKNNNYFVHLKSKKYHYCENNFYKEDSFESLYEKNKIFNSIHSDLENVSSLAKDEVIRLESLYQNALSQKSLALLWGYWEVLTLHFTDKKTEKRTTLLESLVSVNSIKVYAFYYFYRSKNRFDHKFGYEIFDAKYDFSNSLFTEEEIDVINKIKGSLTESTFTDYKEQIINELYEARNAQTHAGFYHKQQAYKMETIAFLLIDIARNNIIEDIKKNPSKELEEILKDYLND